MDPFDALEEVNDYQSFLDFVAALAADRRDEVAKEKLHPSEYFSDRGANGWVHHTIEDYLYGALDCAESHARLSGTFDKEPSWRAFAEFLYCGKIYE
jgi:hypothetical protein